MVSKGFLRNHQKRAGCGAEHLQRALYAAGLGMTGGDTFIHKVCESAGVQVRMEPTYYEKPTSKSRGNGLKMKAWAPQWIINVLQRSWELTRGFTEEEVLPHYAEAIRLGHEDAEHRAAIDTMYRMGGTAEFRAYVIGPRVRAAKLRKEADMLFQNVAKLRAEADELDPPERGSD
jgi:hypothetical protein